MYGLQRGALAHTEQQAIKSPKITCVKPFKRENQRSIYIKTRNMVEPLEKMDMKSSSHTNKTWRDLKYFM